MDALERSSGASGSAPRPTTGWSAVDAPETFEPEQVFAEAYERHRTDVLRYLRARTRDAAAAEDCCQEAYARLLVELRAGRQPRDPAAWLRHVGRNLLVSQARRAQVAHRHAPRLHEPSGHDPTASRVLERESIGDLRAALGRISGPQQRLLLLVASGMTPLEVGALLGASGGAVRTRLHRARRLLLSELEAHGRIA